MNHQPPRAVELTDDESKWQKQLPSSIDWNTEWTPIADAMESLFKSLIDRNAIPGIRLSIFSDPGLAEKGSKSPKQVFESNGTMGDDICRHPRFIEHLRHFVEGPDLPVDAISGFCKVLNDDDGTSGMILDELCRFVRSCVRDYGLDRRSAARGFYKLAVELDIDYDPHVIRAAALSTR